MTLIGRNIFKERFRKPEKIKIAKWLKEDGLMQGRLPTKRFYST